MKQNEINWYVGVEASGILFTLSSGTNVTGRGILWKDLECIQGEEQIMENVLLMSSEFVPCVV